MALEETKAGDTKAADATATGDAAKAGDAAAAGKTAGSDGEAGKGAGDGKTAADGTVASDATDKTVTADDKGDGAEDDADSTDAGDDDSDLMGDSEDASAKKKDAKVADKSKDAAATDDKAAKDDKKAAPDWREGVLKKLETQLGKKAKTDEEKTAVAATLARHKAQLARYPNLEAAAMANLSAQDKLRAGEHKQKPAEDAAPEEVAAWREKNAIPAEAKDYDVPKVDGHQWTEADEPVTGKFKEIAHALDMPKPMFEGIMKGYARLLDDARDAHKTNIAAIDREDKKAARDTLKDEMGGEYQPRVKLLERMLGDDEVFPDGVGKALFEARDSQGRRVALNPAVTKFLMDAALDRYGDAGLISGDAKSEISTRKKEIQNIMRTDRDRYFAEKLDVEYQGILEREEKGNRRGRAA